MLVGTGYARARRSALKGSLGDVGGAYAAAVELFASEYGAQMWHIFLLTARTRFKVFKCLKTPKYVGTKQTYLGSVRGIL